jgi:hypothetical protein
MFCCSSSLLISYVIGNEILVISYHVVCDSHFLQVATPSLPPVGINRIKSSIFGRRDREWSPTSGKATSMLKVWSSDWRLGWSRLHRRC